MNGLRWQRQRQPGAIGRCGAGGHGRCWPEAARLAAAATGPAGYVLPWSAGTDGRGRRRWTPAGCSGGRSSCRHRCVCYDAGSRASLLGVYWLASWEPGSDMWEVGGGGTEVFRSNLTPGHPVAHTQGSIQDWKLNDRTATRTDVRVGLPNRVDRYCCPFSYHFEL